jgi:crotonobetainyl-CoA:carnitine CoA-transferase CaiB-like acyl-CoA transferase
MFVFLQWNSTQRAAFENVVMRRQGARGLGHPWGIYPCKDGHVILIVGAGGRNWARFAELMNIPQLSDPRYQSPAARAQHADEIDALMLPWLMEHTAEEIFTRAQEANLPFGMVRKPGELVHDAQLQAREFFSTEPDGLKWPQLPFRRNGVRPAWTTLPFPGAAK